MQLPTFLGIGAPRAGTTWLHEQLAGHTQVYVPSKCKEVHFFDRYFERGAKWYAKFFPSDSQATDYEAIGEITPHYLYGEECPARINGLLPAVKLILILRHPVDRAYSHYWHRAKLDNFTGLFEDFLTAYPEAIGWGYYSQPLEKYLQFFDSDRILVLIHEKIFTDITGAQNKVAHFLGISPSLFPHTIMEKRSIPAICQGIGGLFILSTRSAATFAKGISIGSLTLLKKWASKKLWGKALPCCQ